MIEIAQGGIGGPGKTISTFLKSLAPGLGFIFAYIFSRKK